MKRYQDNHVVVTLSDEGLRRAYGDNEMLAYLKGTERLHAVVAWVASIGLGFLLAYSACNGN